MTNKEIFKIATCQSAIDSSCNGEDFSQTENKVVISQNNPNARKYLELPFYCDLTSYGNNIVASVNERIAGVVTKYINEHSIENCFETPNIGVLNQELQKFDMSVCFMAEYFLPDADIIKPLECQYETKLLQPKDFEGCYLPQWSNALCEKRRHLDKLAIGAFDKGRLVGMAGCSADCNTMWQIGVDVLPDYRRQGIAAALTSQLAKEILQRGIVPFYCAAWSNIKSVRNAIKSGFRPSWVQITAKSSAFIAEMLK